MADVVERGFLSGEVSMAIQYYCPACSKPIEVDQELGGQRAACPYCNHVASVPTESTLGAAPRARSVGDVSGAAGHQLPPLPSAPMPQTQTRRTGARLGWAALAFVGLAIVCFVIFAGVIISVMGDAGIDLTTQPSQAESTAKLQEYMQRNPAAAAAPVVLIFSGLGLALVAAVLSLVSLTQGVCWQGITALVLSAPMLLCVCAASAQQLLSGG